MTLPSDASFDPASPPLPAGTLPALAIGAAATIGMAVAATAVTGLGPLFAATAMAVYGGAAGLILPGIARHHPAPRFGLPNGVTLGRLVATALVSGAAVEALAETAGGGAPAWSVAAVAIAAIAADGIDGWLARTRGPATAFGARFDMETDALLLMALALFAYATGTAGAAVLLVGLMRYLFVAAGLALPWLEAPLPPSFRRKAVCVLQGIALTVLASPLTAPPWSEALATGALAALTWSFAVDTWWLWRHRPGARS